MKAKELKQVKNKVAQLKRKYNLVINNHQKDRKSKLLMIVVMIRVHLRMDNQRGSDYVGKLEQNLNLRLQI